MPLILKTLSIHWKSSVWYFLLWISVCCVCHSSFYFCVPVATYGCCFCWLCPAFTEHEEGWDMQPDRESQVLRLAPSHLSQLSPTPNDPLLCKAFLYGLLPVLTVPVCSQLSLLGTAQHQKEKAVLAHPAALSVLCQPVTLILVLVIFCFLYLLQDTGSIPRSPAIPYSCSLALPLLLKTFSAVLLPCSYLGLWVLLPVWSHWLPSLRALYDQCLFFGFFCLF